MADAYTIQFDFRGKRFNQASVGLEAYYSAIKADWDGSAKTLSTSLRSFLDSVGTALSRRHGSAWPGGTGAQTLSKRSGDLVNSIIKSVQVRGSTFTTVQGEIGSDMVYAGIQEFGGTIKAKNVKYLTIPLPAAMDKRGVTLKDSARDWPNTFVAKSKAGNLIIFQKRGSQIIPLYVLKTSVTLPPRLGMQKTLDAGVPYFVDKACDDIVKAVMKAGAP